MNEILLEFNSDIFQPNCVNWEGYKPCRVQKELSLPNCSGCNRFTPRVTDFDYRIPKPQYTPEYFLEANSVGIVEMGGLGSVMRTTAVSRAIREINPRLPIKWFTHERGKGLLKYVPGVEGFEIGKDDCEKEALGTDLLINYEMNESAGGLTKLAGRTAGFISTVDDKFQPANEHAALIQRIQIDDPFRKTTRMTMQELLLKSIGLETTPAYDLDLPEEKRVEGFDLLKAKFTEDKPYIGLNIGTSEKGKLRRWPVAHHAELAERLSKDYNVAILNGPDDHSCREEFLGQKDRFNNSVQIMDNDLEIGTFLGVMSHMSRIVTSDTFVFHGARAVDVPVLVMSGPTPHTELELGPRDILIEPKLPCSPCFHRCGREIRGECMHLIGVEEVYGLLN